jgi:hypothetical protein
VSGGTAVDGSGYVANGGASIGYSLQMGYFADSFFVGARVTGYSVESNSSSSSYCTYCYSGSSTVVPMFVEGGYRLPLGDSFRVDLGGGLGTVAGSNSSFSFELLSRLDWRIGCHFGMDARLDYATAFGLELGVAADIRIGSCASASSSIRKMGGRPVF